MPGISEAFTNGLRVSSIAVEILLATEAQDVPAVADGISGLPLPLLVAPVMRVYPLLAASSWLVLKNAVDSAVVGASIHLCRAW